MVTILSEKTKSILGATGVVVGVCASFVHGVLASTAAKTAYAYHKYCPNHGEPVITPFGSMTCYPLRRLVENQEALLPTFAWLVPTVLCAGTAFLAYNYYTTGGISRCCRKQTITDIPNFNARGYQSDY